jgi:toxin-antitoxin system PIN domain toxin
MNSLNFLDINVWLALSWERHAQSEAARSWFDSSESEQFFFCRFTQLGLLRLLTTKAIMGNDTRNMAGAWDLYDRWWADDRVAFLREPEGIDPRLRALARSRQASPKIWADAYLAAFASSAGLRLVTFDRALSKQAPEVLILPSKP